MPRGGAPTFTYSLPAIYLAIPGTLITAAQHNTPLEDIASTFNTAWPVNLGGTGGTSAAAILSGDNTYTGSNTFEGELVVNGVQSETLAAQSDNLSLDAETNVLNITLTGAQSITGITGGTIGRVVIMTNVDDTDTLTVVNDATSTAANRFLLPGSKDFSLLPGQSAILKYNGTRWAFAAQTYSAGAGSGDLVRANQAVTDIASASSVDLSTSNTLEVNITGTTTITEFLGDAGVTYHCRTASALVLTNSADLALPSSANITTEAGDTFDVYMTDGDSAVVKNYYRKSGEALIGQGGITLGTPTAWTSGTAVDFTGSEIITAPSRITASMSGVSLNGTANILIQIGDSGGLKTTGYAGSSSNNGTTVLNHSNGAQINISGATLALYGSLVFSLVDAANYIWSYVGSFSTGAGNICVLSGSVTLNGPLDRLRFTTSNGTDTGDAGTVNVSSEV